MFLFLLAILLGICCEFISKRLILDHQLYNMNSFSVLNQNYDQPMSNSNSDSYLVTSPIPNTPTEFIKEPITKQYIRSQDKVVMTKPLIQPFIFADHRIIFQPNFTLESSFAEYEQRLQNQLQEYVNQEVLCYKEKRLNCISARKEKKRPLAAKPYDEKDLQIHYQKYPVILQVPQCNARHLIGIPVAPSQFAERQAIRATWCNSTIQCIFFCGQSKADAGVDGFVKEEAIKYKDIVQFGLINSYLNLTILQLSTYEWIAQHCTNLTHFIRADSDLFLNPPRLETTLSVTHTGFAYGHVFQHVKPIRDPQSKWYMPKHLYARKVYPSYLSGCMYVWSIDVLKKVVQSSIRPILYIEDVFFGQILDANRIHLTDDSKTVLTTQIPISPKLWKQISSAHRYSPVDLLTIWQLYSTSIVSL